MTVKSDWNTGDSYTSTAANAVAAAVNSVSSYAVDSYGADPTGAAFSDTAVAAAVAALGSNRGSIVFGPGTYKLANPIGTFTVGQSVLGAGNSLTLINFSGSGACIRAYDSRAYTSLVNMFAGTCGPGISGRFAGFTLDGNSAAASSVGIHIGDMQRVDIDVCIRRFAAASCIGLWLDNTVTWTEHATVRAEIAYCTTNVVFDVNGGYPGFGYGDFNFYIFSAADRNGVIIRNAADVVSSFFKLHGGFTTQASTNTGIVLTVGTSGSDASKLRQAVLDIVVETNGNSGVGHKTFAIGAQALLDGQGVLSFQPGAGINFAAGNAKGRTAFTGICDVDTNLGTMAFWQGSRTIGFQAGSAGYLDPGGTLYLEGGNVFAQQMTAGAQTFSIDGVATYAGQAATFDLFIKQPASGSTTITWPGGFVWDAGTAPILSTTTNAVDHVRITTADFTTFYGQHLSNRLVKVAGAVSDAAFPSAPPSGTMGLDTTNHRLYVKDGSTWRYTALT